MVAPLVILAVGAAVGGYVGFPGAAIGMPELNLLAHWLEPAVGPEGHPSLTLEWALMGVSTVVAGAGIGLAFAFYLGGYREPAHKFAAAVPGFVQLVRDKFRVDELYDLVIIRPIKTVARGLFYVVDRVLIDQVLVHGFALVVDIGARVSRIFQVGDIQRYLAVFAIGVAGVVWVARAPAAPDDVVIKVDGTTVEVDVGKGAATGRALEYAFDFDGDGANDRTGTSPTARWVYEGRDTYDIKITIRDPRWDSTTTLKRTVSIK
jgi:hypothetical protein